MNRLGIVVIGRNEGERLRISLQSAVREGVPLVYVDSGSGDGSPALATSMGADVVEVDPQQGFSAARARNEGFDRLMQRDPAPEYVQFVDGDSELVEGWKETGIAALDGSPDVVIVCGRVRERHPEASRYNRLCGLEWEKTPGEIPSCGGIFMARSRAFKAVGGFRPDVVAAEEDELCFRLREKGGKILHVAADMVRHDAAMLRFSQWWTRAQRAGHAYAQGAALHGSSPERHFVRDCRRLWFWGFLIPLLAVAPAWPSRGISLALLALYPLQILRIYRSGRGRAWSASDSRLYSLFAVLSKFPGLLGLLQYRLRRWFGKPMTIIEHKRVRSPG